MGNQASPSSCAEISSQNLTMCFSVTPQCSWTGSKGELAAGQNKLCFLQRERDVFIAAAEAQLLFSLFHALRVRDIQISAAHHMQRTCVYSGVPKLF